MDTTLRRYPHMVQEYYVARIRGEQRRRLEARARVTSRADVLALQKDIRRSIRRSFGPFPRRSPLNPRVTGRIDRRHHVVEKILFESRPGFVVSANLYLPKRTDLPAPCVLGLCGHSAEGKAAESYQSFVQGLVRKGFVVLITDPISQGERVQYPNRKGRCSLGLCPEHNMIGKQQALVGEFFGAWRAWDGIRALDYLLSRPETDRRRVGVTGNSGGGTMTTWLCGLDDRFTMAAPGCFVTTFLANLENELPGDVEQIPPRIIEFGVDEQEFFIPFAPRPLVLLTQERDFFDHRGAVQAYHELKRIYAILGAEGNIRLVTGGGTHGYSRELREAMYGFFAKHAGLRVSASEPKVKLEREKDLWAGKSGLLVREGSKRVWEFTRARADQLRSRRRRLGAKKLASVLKRKLVLPRRPRPVHYRILSNFRVGKLRFRNFALETEPGIQAIITMPDPPEWRVPPPPGLRCNLLVPHLAAAQDLLLPKVKKQLKRKSVTFAVDTRGIGQSMAASCVNAEFFAPYDADYFYQAYAQMLGEPYLGRRVHDVLCTLDWLSDLGYREVHVLARGMGAVVALLACTLDARASSVTLLNGLLSYHELTQVAICGWPASSMLRGVLKAFDLPDCCRALRRKLRVIEPWDARMKAMRPSEVRKRLKDIGLRKR